MCVYVHDKHTNTYTYYMYLHIISNHILTLPAVLAIPLSALIDLTAEWYIPSLPLIDLILCD